MHVKYKIADPNTCMMNKFLFATICPKRGLIHVMDENKQQQWSRTIAGLKRFIEKNKDVPEILEYIEDKELRRRVIDALNKGKSLTDMFYQAASNTGVIEKTKAIY